MWEYLWFALFGFLMGSVLYSYLLPKLLMGIDITALSKDKNPGAFNAFELANSKIGSICLAMDILKGFIPIYLAGRSLDPQGPASRRWWSFFGIFTIASKNLSTSDYSLIRS